MVKVEPTEPLTEPVPVDPLMVIAQLTGGGGGAPTEKWGEQG